MTMVFYIDKVLTSITNFVQKLRKCSGIKKNKVNNNEFHKFNYEGNSTTNGDTVIYK
jgi:hypothetical protein